MAPETKLGRGKALNNQTKEVLQNIYKYFELEIGRDPNSTVTARQLVSHATGISPYALRRAINDKPDVIVKTKIKRKKRRCKKNIVYDEYDGQSIRRIIHSFYTKDVDFPIMKDLHLIIKGDLDYQASLCTLRRHISKLGFKWVEKSDNKSILLEKHDARFARIQYLTKIEGYRSQGRHIVYIGETAIEYSRVASKPKADGSSTILKQPARAKLIILLVGDQNIVWSSLFMFDGNKRDSMKEEFDYKRENYEQYDKWFKFHVLPNLKPGSIVVVDGGSTFHSRLTYPIPHANSRKREMMDYLTAKNVPYTTDMYKPQLYQLVLLHKDRHNEYKIDTLLREHGHTVLRQPTHHPDLNPVKSILFSVVNYIGKDVNVAVEIVMKIAKEKIYTLTEEDWKLACRSAEAEENTLKAIDKVIDEVSERTCRTLDNDDEESEYDENMSEQDSMDSD